ncbi:MAG: long-chain fatty acid--CoA ligase [Smithella sp.]
MMAYRTDTLCGIFHNQALRYGDQVEFLRAKFDKNGNPSNQWHSRTWKETRDEIICLAKGLMILGLNKGDRVVIFSESRPRWIIADQAIQACGAIGVPLYPTLTLDELEYMTQDCGARTVIVSNQDKGEMTLKAKAQGVPVENIITMCTWNGAKPEGVYTFNDVMVLGKQKISDQEVEEKINTVVPEDVASIIYTSGTTGKQKGAILTQKNWMSNIHQCSNSTLLRRQRDLELHMTHLVHLPLCHVFGRTSDYHVGALQQGSILVFAESFEKIAKNIQEIRPNVLVSIPRLWEKIYDTTKSIVSRQNKTTQSIFCWATKLGGKYSDAMATATKMGQFDLIQFAAANILVFNNVKKTAGLDRVVLGISGGGKLSKDVCVFIRSLGIQLSEGYGLTETSPVINFNEPEFNGYDPGKAGWFDNKMIDLTLDLMVAKQSKGLSPYTNPIRALSLSLAYNTVAHKLQIKPGTVGKPVLWTEEKIAEDGEILVRGPQVSKGYWNLPEATAEAFTEDGWFKTGDIGEFDNEGFLLITDRKKELFVSSGGKNIAPHPIELALTAKPYIEQACLLGDARKYITALIVPDFQELHRFSKHNGIPACSDKDLVENEKVKELIKKQVDEVNETLPRYEQIKYYKVLDKAFSVETGELTPTLKLKRRIVFEKYKDEIESLYAN